MYKFRGWNMLPLSRLPNYTKIWINEGAERFFRSLSCLSSCFLGRLQKEPELVVLKANQQQQHEKAVLLRLCVFFFFQIVKLGRKPESGGGEEKRGVRQRVTHTLR